MTKCGCKVINQAQDIYARQIVFCPLHESAEEMLMALKYYHFNYTEGMGMRKEAVNKFAQTVIKKAEAGKTLKRE